MCAYLLAPLDPRGSTGSQKAPSSDRLLSVNTEGWPTWSTRWPFSKPRKAHEHRIQLAAELQPFNNKCFPTLPPTRALGKSWVQRYVWGRGHRKPRQMGAVSEGLVGSRPVSLDPWEHRVKPGTEASPLPRHQQGAPSERGWGCPWAQPEIVRGGQGQQREEKDENRKDAGLSPSPGPLGPCAKSSLWELASPMARLPPLTPALPSWPSSQTLQPHRGLSASPTVCWPVRRKGRITL